jgi:hypothetical protein
LFWKKSYQFQLNEAKFPAIYRLRQKEKVIEDRISSTLKELLSVEKFASRLSKSRGKLDVTEFEGR